MQKNFNFTCCVGLKDSNNRVFSYNQPTQQRRSRKVIGKKYEIKEINIYNVEYLMKRHLKANGIKSLFLFLLLLFLYSSFYFYFLHPWHNWYSCEMEDSICNFYQALSSLWHCESLQRCQIYSACITNKIIYYSTLLLRYISLTDIFLLAYFQYFCFSLSLRTNAFVWKVAMKIN